MHTTRWTVGEGLSYGHRLLRELASTAPGTFQHSVNVGVLANSAASAIGADALLARVGGLLRGLYRDVGKISEYFTENQHGANPHDDLKLWDSARILRSHVPDGVGRQERGHPSLRERDSWHVSWALVEQGPPGDERNSRWWTTLGEVDGHDLHAGRRAGSLQLRQDPR